MVWSSVFKIIFKYGIYIVWIVCLESNHRSHLNTTIGIILLHRFQKKYRVSDDTF